MLERGERRSTGTAVIAADQHNVCVSLGDTSCNCTDANFRHQLDRDARLRISVLQIEYQLSKIFDRIDVVVRRRRHEADARYGVAYFRDHFIDLVTGKLATFTRL